MSFKWSVAVAILLATCVFPFAVGFHVARPVQKMIQVPYPMQAAVDIGRLKAADAASQGTPDTVASIKDFAKEIYGFPNVTHDALMKEFQLLESRLRNMSEGAKNAANAFNSMASFSRNYDGLLQKFTILLIVCGCVLPLIIICAVWLYITCYLRDEIRDRYLYLVPLTVAFESCDNAAKGEGKKKKKDKDSAKDDADSE